MKKRQKVSWIPYPNCRIHTIMAGDTFYKLANQYNTSLDAIMQQNWCLDPYNLQIGQQICIPVPYPCSDCVYHTVRPGDTLYSLINLYKTATGATTGIIGKCNPCLEPKIGQQICIPVPYSHGSYPGPGCLVHTIMKGDTYYKLAQLYNTTIEAIQNQNWCLGKSFPIGQQICIPVPYPCPDSVYHTVRPGDTLYGLLMYYHNTPAVTTGSISKCNPCLMPKIGQQICIPVR